MHHVDTKTILKILKLFPSDYLAFACDDPRKECKEKLSCLIRMCHPLPFYVCRLIANPRKKLYPLYKSQRPDTPQGLKVLLALFPSLFSALNVKPLLSEGIEGDDLIASYCHEGEAYI
jgi:hypothetical protein